METRATEVSRIGDRDNPVNSDRIDLRYADLHEADL